LFNFQPISTMQNTRETESTLPLPFLTKLEDWVGGIVIAASELTQTSLPAGTPVGKDANGLFHVVKQAVMQASATDSATAYKVIKGHDFKVGDFLTNLLAGAAYAITSITTTNSDYDTINIGTTLGVTMTAGDVLFEALAESASDSLFKYTPVGLTGHAIDIVAGSNPAVDCIVRGTVNTAVAPAYNASVKAALPHFIFV
jgi:hypothetical protein